MRCVTLGYFLDKIQVMFQEQRIVESPENNPGKTQ